MYLPRISSDAAMMDPASEPFLEKGGNFGHDLSEGSFRDDQILPASSKDQRRFQWILYAPIPVHVTLLAIYTLLYFSIHRNSIRPELINCMEVEKLSLMCSALTLAKNHSAGERCDSV